MRVGERIKKIGHILYGNERFKYKLHNFYSSPKLN